LAIGRRNQPNYISSATCAKARIQFTNPTLSMWIIGLEVASKINVKYSFAIGLNCFYYPKA
jgi:hypothetical protein